MVNCETKIWFDYKRESLLSKTIENYNATAFRKLSPLHLDFKFILFEIYIGRLCFQNVSSHFKEE